MSPRQSHGLSDDEDASARHTHPLSVQRCNQSRISSSSPRCRDYQGARRARHARGRGLGPVGSGGPATGGGGD